MRRLSGTIRRTMGNGLAHVIELCGSERDVGSNHAKNSRGSGGARWQINLSGWVVAMLRVAKVYLRRKA